MAEAGSGCETRTVMTVGWRPSFWLTPPPTPRFRRPCHARPRLRSRRLLDRGRPPHCRRSGRPSLPRQRRQPWPRRRPGRPRRPRRRPSRAARLPRRVRHWGHLPLNQPSQRAARLRPSPRLCRQPRPNLRTPRSRRCYRRCSVKTLRLEAGRCASISGRGGVAELADAHALGACAVRRGGSSPPFPTVNQARSSTEMPARRSLRVGAIAASGELADASRAAEFTRPTD